jgi:hypothetical protein
VLENSLSKLLFSLFLSADRNENTVYLVVDFRFLSS